MGTGQGLPAETRRAPPGNSSASQVKASLQEDSVLLQLYGITVPAVWKDVQDTLVYGAVVCSPSASSGIIYSIVYNREY